MKTTALTAKDQFDWLQAHPDAVRVTDRAGKELYCYSPSKMNEYMTENSVVDLTILSSSTRTREIAILYYLRMGANVEIVRG